MFRLATFLVGSLIALLASAACGGEEPSIPIVGVTAADFSFSLPDTIAGGLVRFQLTNSGQDSHHMQVVKLNQGGYHSNSSKGLSKKPFRRFRRKERPL